MQVYAEFALLENFCMDFTLLYCAKLVCKNRAGRKRIAAASLFGACFAVTFPLFGLNAAAAVAVKILSGAAMCLVAGKFSSFKSYLKFAAAFMGFSAALAGALIGIFSLAGLEFSEGNGYIMSSVPVGIPLFGALVLLFAARAVKNKFFGAKKGEVKLKVSSGGRSVKINGFVDSGNKVYFRGEPVTVIPESVAEKLVETTGITEGVKVHTVAGSETIKVFTADSLEIDFGDKKSEVKRVKIGVSRARLDCAVLHPDILED